MSDEYVFRGVGSERAAFEPMGATQPNDTVYLGWKRFDRPGNLKFYVTYGGTVGLRDDDGADLFKGTPDELIAHIVRLRTLIGEVLGPHEQNGHWFHDDDDESYCAHCRAGYPSIYGEKRRWNQVDYHEGCWVLRARAALGVQSSG